MISLLVIEIFSLFRPAEFHVRPVRGSVLIVDGREIESARPIAIREPARIHGRGGAPAEFVLEIPGKISRRFQGRLEIVRRENRLAALLQIERETAAASIASAESPSNAPLEALKAQAVLARSFLTAARGRHQGFDFCDTTHCQFLREPPRPDTPAYRAASATTNLVLMYEGRAIETLYSADCGGNTRSLAEAGWSAMPYPYFGVKCPVRGEASGHRIGLCQKGAAQLARKGLDFRAILGHYFPGALVSPQP